MASCRKRRKLLESRSSWELITECLLQIPSKYVPVRTASATPERYFLSSSWGAIHSNAGAAGLPIRFSRGAEPGVGQSRDNSHRHGTAARDDDGVPNPGTGPDRNVSASPWFQSLDGPRKFHGSLRPSERPVDFYRPSFSDAAWGTIPVPSSWQMHGFDIPIYTNIIYPWPQDPHGPSTPPYNFNPVGSYRVHFTLPAGWTG
jgi:hypothetical protein